MANVAYGVGNDARINSIPINDGLILFNTTQHTLSMDSDNARNIYGSNNINILSSKNLSTNSTYSKLYVDDNFMLQNRLATTSETSNLLGDTTALTNDCVQNISKVLNDNMRGMCITDLDELDTITTNYNESVINTYFERYPSYYMQQGGYVRYVIHLNRQYDFLVVNFSDNETPTDAKQILVDMQIINNCIYNQFNQVIINDSLVLVYRNDFVGHTEPLQDCIWKPNDNNIIFSYTTSDTSDPPILRYSITCKGYIYK